MIFESNNRQNVPQCTHTIGDNKELVLTTILGSCVAACIFDPVTKIGGMNHILLPGEAKQSADVLSSMYGSNLMELLLNDLYKQGAVKRRLEVKLFGGAMLADNSMQAGERNVEFILKYTQTEGLNVVTKNLGGELGRRIEFHPSTGRSRQKFLNKTQFEKPILSRVLPKVETGAMELF